MLERVDQLGGATRASAAAGQRVWFSVGPRIAVADVADPASPQILGLSTPLEDWACRAP